VNRQNIPPQNNPPYTNGHYEAPLELSGVSLRPPAAPHQPTVFPPDLPPNTFDAVVYALQRFHFGGIPLARYIVALWVAIGITAAIGLIPGQWFTVTVALILLVAQIVWSERIRRRKYVNFHSVPIPPLAQAPLDSTEKLPIYATGLFSVEGRYQHYSALPGFYRTFATGEHAVLCRVTERSWLKLFSWAPEEAGMWYVFVNPEEIEQLAWGKLDFGKTSYPAVAIHYRLELPPGPRRKKSEVRHETLYLATPKIEDAQRLLVDLQVDLPENVRATTYSAPS
jgi:hypothetical protein